MATMLLPWLCCLALLVSAATADYKSDFNECAGTLMALTVCQAYASNQAPKPTPDCCRSLQTVMDTKRKCLCVLIKDRNEEGLKAYKIDLQRALSLPDSCNVRANISECPQLLNLDPNSPEARDFQQATSNSPASAAGGSQREKNGCGERSSYDKGRRMMWLGWEVLRGLFIASIMAILAG